MFGWANGDGASYVVAVSKCNRDWRENQGHELLKFRKSAMQDECVGSDEWEGINCPWMYIGSY